MDNDLMARRLRPPSEPVHQASTPTTPQPAPAQQPVEQAQPEWPTADAPETVENATVETAPAQAVAAEPVTQPAAADEPVTDAAADATTVDQVTDEPSDVPWEFEPADSTTAAWAPPADEPAASLDKATEAQVEHEAPWAEAASEAPWADTATDEAPWAEAASEAPWADTATDEAPWAEAASEAPWADTATDEAPWAEAATEDSAPQPQASHDKPWESPADASPSADTFAPAQSEWVEANEELWPETALAPMDQVAAAADPDDAFAPVLPDVEQSAATLWPNLNAQHPQDQDGVEQPVAVEGPQLFAPEISEESDEPQNAADADTADAVTGPVEMSAVDYEHFADYEPTADQETSEPVEMSAVDYEHFADYEPTADQETSEPVEMSAVDYEQFAEYEPTTDQEATAEPVEMSAVDEHQPVSYDPTADFQLFGSEDDHPVQAVVDALEPDVTPIEASTPSPEVVAQQPDDSDTGSTPPDELFAVGEVPAQEAFSFDEPVAEAVQEPESVVPEPVAEAVQEPVQSSPSPVLVPMITTASAIPSTGNPGSLVLRIELKFAEQSGQHQLAAELETQVETPQDDPHQSDERDEWNELSQATAQSERKGAWVEPDADSIGATDDWTSPPMPADVPVEPVVPGTPITAEIPESQPSTANLGETAHPAEPEPAGVSSLNADNVDAEQVAQDPLSRVPAASLKGVARAPDASVLAAAMSVGPATTPAIPGPGQWFLPPKRKAAVAGVGGEQGAQVTQSSPILTAAVTVGMAALVIVLVLVFVLVMTSILH